MINAKGSLLFLRRELVAGMALRVDRTYLGEQLANGEGVTEDCAECQWHVRFPLPDP